jgi:hypothetical protein
LAYYTPKSRDSSVTIATVYGLDGRGSIPSRGMRLFSIQPPLQWVPGFISLRVKQLGHEAESASSTAEVKNGGAIPLFPLIIHGVVLN